MPSLSPLGISPPLTQTHDSPVERTQQRLVLVFLLLLWVTLQVKKTLEFRDEARLGSENLKRPVLYFDPGQTMSHVLCMECRRSGVGGWGVVAASSRVWGKNMKSKNLGSSQC